MYFQTGHVTIQNSKQILVYNAVLGMKVQLKKVLNRFLRNQPITKKSVENQITSSLKNWS